MGISATRLLASSIAALAGFPPHELLAGPHFITESAFRIFFDVTAALRSSFGRAFLVQVMSEAGPVWASRKEGFRLRVELPIQSSVEESQEERP